MINNKNNLIILLLKYKIFENWGLGIGPNPQSPIPNPQSPIPNPQYKQTILFIVQKINNY